MMKSKSKIVVFVGALLVSGVAGCGGRMVSGTDDTPRPVAESPVLSPTASREGKPDAGAGTASNGTGNGTNESHTSAPPPVYGSAYGARTPACVGLGSSCSFDADCCKGSWCNNRTYTPPTCLPPVPNGYSCEANDHCQSGICENYSCVAKSCVEAGTACDVDADCCKGSFCDTQSYGPTQCATTQPVGRFCMADRWCQSGRCVGYQCTSG